MILFQWTEFMSENTEIILGLHIAILGTLYLSVQSSINTIRYIPFEY
jgi:hypothetical protein